MLQSGQISFQKWKGNNKLKEIKKEGQEEALKEYAKKEEEVKHTLDALVEKSTYTLLKVSAHPPFSLSSTDIVVDIDQVSIRHKDWIGSSQLLGISIEDIGSVRVDVGPFYATLTFIGIRPGPETTQVIEYLKKDEAVKARRIIQGLIVARKEQIDLSIFETEEIVKKLETLGQTQAIE